MCLWDQEICLGQGVSSGIISERLNGANLQKNSGAPALDPVGGAYSAPQTHQLFVDGTSCRRFRHLAALGLLNYRPQKKMIFFLKFLNVNI